MPLRRSRSRRRPDHEQVGVLDLRGRLGGWTGPRPLTDVDQPDVVTVVRHARPLELSSAADWELEMAQWVDALAARGALDAGTAYVADEMIRTRLAAELALVDTEARDAAVTNRMLAGVDQENLQRAQAQLADLRADDRQLRARIARTTAVLEGRQPVAEPEATPTADAADEASAVALRALPPSLPLQRLVPVRLTAPATPPAATDPTPAATPETGSTPAEEAR